MIRGNDVTSENQMFRHAYAFLPRRRRAREKSGLGFLEAISPLEKYNCRVNRC